MTVRYGQIGNAISLLLHRFKREFRAAIAFTRSWRADTTSLLFIPVVCFGWRNGIDRDLKFGRRAAIFFSFPYFIEEEKKNHMSSVFTCMGGQNVEVQARVYLIYCWTGYSSAVIPFDVSSWCQTQRSAVFYMEIFASLCMTTVKSINNIKSSHGGAIITLIAPLVVDQSTNHEVMAHRMWFKQKKASNYAHHIFSKIVSAIWSVFFYHFDLKKKKKLGSKLHQQRNMV